MIVESNQYEKITSNVSITGEFKIRNSAKAFSILSSGLYSNKIKAIIRELSCNAIDSHKAAKTDVPFDVHLPSMLEPYFSVRDFGTGLDHNSVVNIYTTYFESTKTDSNDFIGALGLGSKSPFSYTGNFTVTAIKNGVSRIYSAFINEQGIPSISLMNETKTTEHNGVEVKFAVLNQQDYYQFKKEAAEVFRWFETHPRIIGEYSPIVHKYKEKDIIPGVHIRDTHYQERAIAIMGNIAYPLSSLPNPTTNLGIYESFLNCSLEIHFEIGELDFAASREDLSYIPQTIESIKNKFEKLASKLEVFIKEKCDPIKNDWEKASYLRQTFSDRLLSASVKKYITDTKFELVDISGRCKIFKWYNDALDKKGVKLACFTTYCGKTKTSRLTYDRWDSASNSHKISTDLAVEDKVIFVLNDLKRGAQERARYHYAKLEKSYTVYVVDSTFEDKEKVYKEFLKDIHNPPGVVYASTLEKKEKTATVSTAGILNLSYYQNGNHTDISWKSITTPFPANDKEIRYYVTLKNYDPYTVINGEEVHYDLAGAVHGIVRSKIQSLDKIVIYGVRKNRMNDIKDLRNWINLEVKITEEVNKIDDKVIKKMIAGEVLSSSYGNREYISWDMPKYLTNNSFYYQFCEKYKNFANSDSLSAVLNLCKNRSKNFEIEKIRREITNDFNKLKSRYPLLGYLSCHTAGDVKLPKIADYIKLIDQNPPEKKNV